MAGGAASAFGFGVAAPGYRSGRRAAVESWTATSDDIDAWLKIARVGDTFVYCYGPELIRGAAFKRVSDLARAGEIIPHNRRRGDDGFDFFIRRSRVRVVTQRPAPPACDPDMLAVLLILQDAAQHGRRCPFDTDIAAALDLTADQVKWRVAKLADARLIERRTLPLRGGAKFRIVKIVSTGMETAGPGGGQ